MYFCTNFTENTCLKTMLANVVIYWRSCNEQWQLLTEKENKDGCELMIHFITAIHWCTKARFSISVFYSPGHKHWRHSATGQLHLLLQCLWNYGNAIKCQEVLREMFLSNTSLFLFNSHWPWFLGPTWSEATVHHIGKKLGKWVLHDIALIPGSCVIIQYEGPVSGKG